MSEDFWQWSVTILWAWVIINNLLRDLAMKELEEQIEQLKRKPYAR